MGRLRDQRAISLAMSILDRASYEHSAGPVASIELALALTVLLRFVRDRSGLDEFWHRASTRKPEPWATGSCRESYYGVAAELRSNGWDAPPIPSPPCELKPASTPALDAAIAVPPSRA